MFIIYGYKIWLQYMVIIYCYRLYMIIIYGNNIWLQYMVIIYGYDKTICKNKIVILYGFKISMTIIIIIQIKTLIKFMF